MNQRSFFLFAVLLVCALTANGTKIDEKRGKYSNDDSNPCDSHPCKNGGECIQEPGLSFKCKCKDGYTGKVCQNEEDRCENNPCKRGGTCITLPGYEFKCQCPKGYHGDVCESDIDECQEHKGGCQDVCVNTIGSYRCECSDPELSLAHDHYHCVAIGAEVECRQHDMVIYLPKELLYGLDNEHLRLIDVNCRAKENATHFILETGLTKCGTILNHRKGFVVYSNMVSEIPLEQHQVVTRVRQAMIQFHCYYSDWGVVSSIGIKPKSKKIVFSSKGFGSFTITLDLFRKPKYFHPFSEDDYPVMFYLRERMYFEVTVETKDSRLTIFPLDCYATPSQDPNSLPRYDAIVNGCPVDDTLEYHVAANPQSKRFSLEAFQYVSKHPYVFFHCRVKICNVTDPYSRCAQGCIKDRHRRGAQTAAETMDDVYSLAQGPLTLNRAVDEPAEEAEIDNEQNPQEAEVATGFDIPVVAALALVIGVCVVGMSYMGWKKQQQKAMRRFIPLYEDVQK